VRQSVNIMPGTFGMSRAAFFVEPSAALVAGYFAANAKPFYALHAFMLGWAIALLSFPAILPARNREKGSAD
jgi:hypothetical protein